MTTFDLPHEIQYEILKLAQPKKMTIEDKVNHINKKLVKSIKQAFIGFVESSDNTSCYGEDRAINYDTKLGYFHINNEFDEEMDELHYNAISCIFDYTESDADLKFNQDSFECLYDFRVLKYIENEISDSQFYLRVYSEGTVESIKDLDFQDLLSQYLKSRIEVFLEDEVRVLDYGDIYGETLSEPAHFKCPCCYNDLKQSRVEVCKSCKEFIKHEFDCYDEEMEVDLTFDINYNIEYEDKTLIFEPHKLQKNSSRVLLKNDKVDLDCPCCLETKTYDENDIKYWSFEERPFKLIYEELNMPSKGICCFECSITKPFEIKYCIQPRDTFKIIRDYEIEYCNGVSKFDIYIDTDCHTPFVKTKYNFLPIGKYMNDTGEIKVHNYIKLYLEKIQRFKEMTGKLGVFGGV